MLWFCSYYCCLSVSKRECKYKSKLEFQLSVGRTVYPHGLRAAQWSSQRTQIYPSSTWALINHSLGEQKLITGQAGGKRWDFREPKISFYSRNTKPINVSTVLHQQRVLMFTYPSCMTKSGKKVNTVVWNTYEVKAYLLSPNNCYDFSGNCMVDISYQLRLCVV